MLILTLLSKIQEITKLSLSDDPEFLYSNTEVFLVVLVIHIQLWKPGFDPTTFFVFSQVYDNDGNPIEGAYVDVNGDNQITKQIDKLIKKQHQMPLLDLPIILATKILI